MKTTKKLLEIETRLEEHRKIPPTNIFTERAWQQTLADLMSRYTLALEEAGYKSAEERQEELKEQGKWKDLFSKYPVEQPRRTN